MTPAILDHLWQSTLVALGVVLLMAAFRKSAASVRYGLWFAASAKFVVPFAALAALGRFLAPNLHLPVDVAPEAVFIARATQPFAHAAQSRSPLPPLPEAAFARSYAAPSAHATLHLNLGLILATVWALGCVVVLISWMIRSARVRAMVRSATLLPWSGPMPVLASSSLLEPGLIGLWRPVLIVPKTLPDHLAQPEIDAILAHEACHLRRRDNLTAAFHMLIEALFWFHPLVWWIGARLIEERERACDEAVVRSGHDRAVYARSLVESCRLYLQSPLSCVAGASGSDLKRRVELIMTAPFSSPLTPPKKALLVAAGVCAFATPVAAGLLTSPAGQQAVAHAAAAAASLAARAIAPSAPEDTAPAKMIVVAQNRPILVPGPSVTASDAPPLPLVRDAPLRLADLTSPPAAVQAAQPAPDSAALSAAPAASVAQSAEPVDPKTQAFRFVQAYAAATPKRQVIARWITPICLRVVGLAADQEAAVRARVEQVAKAVGLGVRPVKCRDANVEIGFTTDPQHMLDDVVARKAGSLGDATSGTRTETTVTRPIQAWYLTNGAEYAQNSTTDLKALVLYQSPPTTQQEQLWGAQAAGNPNNSSPYPSSDQQWIAGDGQFLRRFLHVMVIIDLRRTGNTKLSLLTDYAAMLALSQPRSLDHCNVLPSITDLFAGPCTGRGVPDLLTPADAAYLAALYAPGREQPGFGLPRTGSQQDTDIAERMARILASTKVATN